MENKCIFANKTVFINGGTRGIGKAIGLKLAKDGANVVIAGKTVAKHPKLDGTIYTAVEEVNSVGGKGLAVKCDVRSEQDVIDAIDRTVREFGGIDVIINNASAVYLTDTEQTSMKSYDLMQSVITRGSFLVSKYAIPYLKLSSNPHILNICPPIDSLATKWLAPHLAYTVAKYGQSMMTMGLASELSKYGIAVNGLWPRTIIWTSAFNVLGNGSKSTARYCRKPDIMADAAYAMLAKDAKLFTGRFAVDEQLLREEGLTDMDQYAIQTDSPLVLDFFLTDNLLTGDNVVDSSVIGIIFANKTVFINGGTRGIGKAIGLKLAKDGANVVIAGKTVAKHPKLDGTIYTAAEEVNSVGGKGLAVKCDVRSEQDVIDAIDRTVREFGGIDVVINNASAICLTDTEQTSMKSYDLMHSVITRGSFLVSKYAIPYLKLSSNPHILNICPPIDSLASKWLAPHLAYTVAKYGQSMITMGLASELAEYGIAVNGLWPRTMIWTSVFNIVGTGGHSTARYCRKPDIMADAAYAMLAKDAKLFTGRFAVDEQLLRDEGLTDMDQYAIQTDSPLVLDFFLTDNLLTGDNVVDSSVIGMSSYKDS
ncbi:uncharacterized protein LOC128955238 [Oppia nitens]|uniref:uncharacterized protein LOC128955238 n=1 Tax=Oppia nitens TaxID=1686743 RepID=UPI0023DCB307|nr:uncharacterized protein LOC128955238 [Oppia nitens]